MKIEATVNQEYTDNNRIVVENVVATLEDRTEIKVERILVYKDNAQFGTIYKYFNVGLLCSTHERNFCYLFNSDEWVCDIINSSGWITYAGEEGREEAEEFGLTYLESYLKELRNQLD